MAQNRKRKQIHIIDVQEGGKRGAVVMRETDVETTPTGGISRGFDVAAIIQGELLRLGVTLPEADPDTPDRSSR